MKKKQQWQQFAVSVSDHIENYVVPQYGDFPDQMIEDWSIWDLKSVLIRYHARIGTNARGINESKRDCLKIAHYACYIYNKLKEEL